MGSCIARLAAQAGPRGARAAAALGRLASASACSGPHGTGTRWTSALAQALGGYSHGAGGTSDSGASFYAAAAAAAATPLIAYAAPAGEEEEEEEARRYPKRARNVPDSFQSEGRYASMGRSPEEEEEVARARDADRMARATQLRELLLGKMQLHELMVQVHWGGGRGEGLLLSRGSSQCSFQALHAAAAAQADSAPPPPCAAFNSAACPTRRR